MSGIGIFTLYDHLAMIVVTILTELFDITSTDSCVRLSYILWPQRLPLAPIVFAYGSSSDTALTQCSRKVVGS